MRAPAHTRRMVDARALLLVTTLLLAGCAETNDVPAGGGSTASIAGYHEHRSPEGPNMTIFVLRADGAAERITFLNDRSELGRAAPGISLAADELRALFDARGAGGLVLRVEHGSIPSGSRTALQEALAAPLPPSTVPDNEFADAETVVALDPLRVARLWEHEARDAAVFKAFRDAQAAFVVEDVEEAALPTTMLDGCARLSTSIEPASILAGETARITTTIENCGDAPLRLADSGCGGDGVPLSVQILAPMRMPRNLPSGSEPRAAYAIDFACRGVAQTLAVPPGATANVTRAWNGTFAACRGGDTECVFEQAEPGSYAVVSYVPDPQAQHRHTELRILPAGPPDTPFLLVKEYAWVNATSTTGDDRVMAHFGGHCAPAHYALEPPTIEERFAPDDPPGGTRAIVMRDHRDTVRSEHVVTVSADMMDMVKIGQNGTAALASPFDRDAIIATLEMDGDAFIVNGTRLAPGESMVLRATFDVRGHEGSEFDTTNVLVIQNVGLAHVLRQQVFGCA